MALSRRTGQRFQASIWPGFVDAMTGLLLVLMFLLTIFMVVQFVLRETITGQETELDALSNEVSALASALGLEERKSGQLQARLGALTATLNQTQTDLDAAQAELTDQAGLIDTLIAERDRQDAALARAQVQITGFEAQVAALIADRDRARDTIATLEDDRAQLLSDQEALNLALAQSRTEIDAQTEAARLAAARREALEALVADLQQQGELTQAQVTDLQAQLSDEEAARLAEAAAAQALRDRLQNADAELTAMTLALEAQRKDAEDTLTLLAAADSARAELDGKLAEALAQLATTQAQAQDRDALAERLAQVLAQMETAQTENAQTQSALQAELAATRADLAQARAQVQTTEQDQASIESRLLAALDALEQAQAAATDQAVLRSRLMAALAARDQAETTAAEQMSLAEQRAVLLAKARETLAQEEQKSTEAQRQTALLNQQVAALRTQLGSLRALLDDLEERDATAQVQLQNLGTDLNAALARAASEERKRRMLEEAERKRLEAEAEALTAEARALQEKAQDLERYRSEFFGRLRDVLGEQEGVRIEGDRFVFSSEVLFAPASAELSPDGEVEIAKVARILRSVAGSIPPGIDWVIRVDGHTDDTPLSGFGKYADNWELSQGRALSVVRYMVDALGIPPDRLAANGFGQYQPINTADTPEARAQNRRIEFKLTEK
jgi:chemotaxis protein MotB